MLRVVPGDPQSQSLTGGAKREPLASHSAQHASEPPPSTVPFPIVVYFTQAISGWRENRRNSGMSVDGLSRDAGLYVGSQRNTFVFGRKVLLGTTFISFDISLTRTPPDEYIRRNEHHFCLCRRGICLPVRGANLQKHWYGVNLNFICRSTISRRF